MIAHSVYIPLKQAAFNLAHCTKGSWLVLLHARRMPPHVGMVINGNYNSLTVKGQELDIPLEAVYKALNQKKIESVFIKVAAHPVFGADYQLAVLQDMILKYPSVKQNEATCLSPIKLFFEEFYAVPLQPDELLFDFMGRLNSNQYLKLAAACNFEMKDDLLELPAYTTELLNEKIKNERMPFYND